MAVSVNPWFGTDTYEGGFSTMVDHIKPVPPPPSSYTHTHIPHHTHVRAELLVPLRRPSSESDEWHGMPRELNS